MPKPISAALDTLGLYRPLKKILRYLTDHRYLRNDLEIRADIRRTRREVDHWAAQGAENADRNHIFAIVSFTNLPIHAKFHCLAAKAMQLRGYTPLIFTSSGSRYAHKYFYMFGIDRLVMWDQVQRDNPWTQVQAQKIVNGFNLESPTVSQIKGLSFNGVDVGKHALSMTCRKRVEGRLNLRDKDTLDMLRSYLLSAVQNVLLAEWFFGQTPVEKMLVRDAGYIPNGPIYEVALNSGIDCVVLEFGQRRSTWVFKRYTPETKGRHYFSLSSSTWEQIRKRQWTPEDEEILKREFAGRYRPDSTDDTRRLQAGKRIKSPEEVRAQLGLDPNKKTAVIFSHVAWDAAFFFGDCLFEDFEEWLFQTVKFVAEECSHMNWIVKEHPFNVFKLQRESVHKTSEQRLLAPLMPFPDHVCFMPADTDINTQSLFPLVDYVLTVNGTVGMEFPCYGVPAVVAGSGRYDGFGFTIEPKSREEYFETLHCLHEIPPLDPETQQLARKHFYALMIGKQISFEDVAPMELKKLHEAQSDVHDNIHFIARSLDEFRAAPSVNLLGDWLAFAKNPDLLLPLDVSDQLQNIIKHTD